MQWMKKGMIFKPERHFDWMISHAQVPTVLVMNDRFRVYFATRDANSISHVACIDLDLHDPRKILKLYENPVLTVGALGAFDEDGVVPSCILENGKEIWLYYNGWNKKVTTPYHNAIGLAVSTDGGLSFTRMGDGPVIDRTINEPYMHVSPSVIKDGDMYKMWYVSGTKWITVNKKHEPVYVLRYATSTNGILWNRTGLSCIPQAHESEAIATPSVIIENGLYKMWYCYRESIDFRDGQGSYRMGYAESTDGLGWERKDAEVGLDQASEEWDSLMQCYPYVTQYNKRLYMFYSGNGFGRSGIGYAVMPN